MADEAGSAADHGDAAHCLDGEANIGQDRRHAAGDVEGQVSSHDRIDRVVERPDRLDPAPGAPRFRRHVEQALGARIDRVVMRMAEARHAFLLRPVFFGDALRPLGKVLIGIDHLRKQPPRPRHGADMAVADRQQPGGDRHLDIVRHLAFDQARDQRAGCDPVIHQHGQTGIEAAGFTLGRQPPGDGQEKRLAEAADANDFFQRIVTAQRQHVGPRMAGADSRDRPRFFRHQAASSVRATTLLAGSG